MPSLSLLNYQLKFTAYFKMPLVHRLFGCFVYLVRYPAARLFILQIMKVKLDSSFNLRHTGVLNLTGIVRSSAYTCSHVFSS